MREKRSLPPADYSLKVESFKLLSDSTVEKFESGVFKSGGYNWYVHPFIMKNEYILIINEYIW